MFQIVELRLERAELSKGGGVELLALRKPGLEGGCHFCNLRCVGHSLNSTAGPGDVHRRRGQNAGGSKRTSPHRSSALWRGGITGEPAREAMRIRHVRKKWRGR